MCHGSHAAQFSMSMDSASGCTPAYMGPCTPCQEMKCDQLSAPQVAGHTASGSLCLLNNFPPRLWLWTAHQPVMCYNDAVLQGLDCTVSPAAPGGSGKAPTALQAGRHGRADHMHAGASPMHIQCDAAKHTCAKMGSSSTPTDRLLLLRGCLARSGWFQRGKQVIIVIIITLSSTRILWPCWLMLVLQQAGPSPLWSASSTSPKAPAALCMRQHRMSGQAATRVQEVAAALPHVCTKPAVLEHAPWKASSNAPYLFQIQPLLRLQQQRPLA